MAQVLIVALLVVGCSLRAAWLLAPAAARRRVAGALVTWNLPSWLATPLRKHAQAASSGCACDGCDKGGAAVARPNAASTVAPITFHRRLPR